MGYRQTRGIILRRRDAFEEDQEISLLTPDLGGITARAPHARKSQKTYCGRLEPPNEVRTRLYKAREHSSWTVSEVRIQTVFADLFESELRTELWPLLSLHLDLFPEGEPAEQAFIRLRKGFEYLQDGFEPARLVVVRILARLLEFQGIRLPLTECVVCSSSPSDREGVIALDRGYLCSECGSSSEPNQVSVGREMIEFLNSLLEKTWSELLKDTVSTKVLVETEQLLYRLFHFHFEISVDALKIRNRLQKYKT